MFSQVCRRSNFKFCVYKLAEAISFLKFRREFVIIGRARLVFSKVQVKSMLAEAVF